MVTRSKGGVLKPNPRYALHTVAIPTEPKTVSSIGLCGNWMLQTPFYMEIFQHQFKCINPLVLKVPHIQIMCVN
ncbi:hypothetical protein CFOL_v3_16568 [Cephalotus follicularis]|uniref:Uncharacterized protein n=1 Tax=Cephalotus follicularis TaxID=3775 RepID=A0A1Q3BYW8_CEPFO|nr:hypothetical protein CFOL_v3_16568 [Cephalotus follicularis]